MTDSKGLNEAIQSVDIAELNERDLNELAYTISETGLLEDSVDSISPEQLLFCWRAVEWMRREGGFPKQMQM